MAATAPADPESGGETGSTASERRLCRRNRFLRGRAWEGAVEAPPTLERRLRRRNPCLGGGGSEGGPSPPPSLARRRGRFLLSALRGSGRLTLVLLLGLGVLLALLPRDFGPIHQLEDGHGSPVTGTRSRLEDALIAADAVTRSRRDGVEELLDDYRVRNHGEHLSPRVEIVPLGQRHHVVGEPTDRLGLGHRGGDALVAEQRHEQVAKERPPMRGDAPELEPRPAVPHFAPPRPSAPRRFGSMRIPRERPSAASAVLISSMDLDPRFFTFSRSWSVFCTRSATTMISAFFSALIARAGSGSSSSGLARLSWRKPSPEASISSSSSSRPSGASGEKWSRTWVAARARASSGDTAPLVQTSRMSFS